MQCRIADLRCKEVINVCTGFRLGFVCDVLVDTLTGCVIAIVVPGPCRFFGLFWHEDDYVIPWECIRCIGEDIILIDVGGDYRREKRRKFIWV
ncbi:YlmC/YmxH family sporulation protein [Oscillospiraceae bacterium CM]|nr:YlmC/YmxH family sporulation protein [Oscillospiraceae bacterium CM]